MKTLKYIVLLTVMLVNMTPYIKDGKLEWKTTHAQAQIYTIEHLATNKWLCKDESLPLGSQLFISPIDCDLDLVCACRYCKKEIACDDTCKNMNCPDKIRERICPACNGPLDINNKCINCNCYNSVCYEEPTPPSGGGGGGGGGGTPEENEEKPCADLVRGVSNPLVNMSLAPPNPNKPQGATYGKDIRYYKGNFNDHDGYDFYGAVGTPVYATHSGTIASLPYEDQQPNRVNKKYPAGYTGDTDGAGNRIYINIGNNTQVAYFHLQAGKPIANNPRTGEPFKGGDQIYAGEIIGYIGVTGNASPNVPHLHYGVREIGGKWKDPLPYINTTIDSNYNLSTPCDD